MQIITADNYYECTDYMSVSLFKKFQKCEVGGLVPFKNPTIPMLVGSHVDAYVEGTLEQFKKQHNYIAPSKAPAGHNNILTNKGELKAEFKLAEEICRFIDQDRRCQQFLSGEKQTVMTGYIAGVPFKIKMDSYSPDKAITDLKILRTVTNNQGQFYDFIRPYGYDLQLGAYQEIVKQNTGKQLPCFICAISKENPINSVIVSIPQIVLDKAMYTITSNVEHYWDIYTGKKEPVGCGICEHCIMDRLETPIISMLDFADF